MNLPELSALLDTVTQIIGNPRGRNAAILALLSFAIYVITANVIWRIEQNPASRAAKTLQHLKSNRPLQAGYALVRLAYYLVIPFAAFFLGWIDLRSIGLGALDWAEGARWAIVILLAAWLLLMVVWLPYLRATIDIPAAPETQQTWARRFVEIIYMQAHWAFYRAAAITLLTGVIADSLYWGTVVGLSFVGLEAFLNPRLRSQLVRLGAADHVIWNMGQAFINALAFLVTRNLLLLVVIHFLLEISIPHTRSARPASRAGAPPPPPARKTSAARK